jgi:hypothetical protein
MVTGNAETFSCRLAGVMSATVEVERVSIACCPERQRYPDLVCDGALQTPHPSKLRQRNRRSA